MPENQQITQEQLGLMCDIIGGLAGQSLMTMLQSSPQESGPSLPTQTTSQVASSPYSWNKFLTKDGRSIPQPRAQDPHAQKVKPPKVELPRKPSLASSAQQPQRVLDYTPEESIQNTEVSPPQDQHTILEEIKKETQHQLKPGGTELAHWIRIHELDRSTVSQYEALGVGSLDELTDTLNNKKTPQNGINLSVFHDDTSPFTLISNPREDFSSGIPAVVVGYPYSNQVHNLELAFPGVHFMTSEEAPKELEESAAKLKQPLSSFPTKKLDNIHIKAEENSQPQQSPKPKQAPQTRKPQEPRELEGTKPYQPQQNQQQNIQQQNNRQQQPIIQKQPLQTLASFQVQGPSEELDLPSNLAKTREYVHGQDMGDIPLETEQEFTLEPLSQEEGDRLVSDYVQKFIQTKQLPEPNYSSELPDDELIRSAPFKSFPVRSLHGKSIGIVTVNNTPFFYKTVHSDEDAKLEILASDLGKIAGVPIPNVKVLPEPKSNEFGTPLLTSWIHGNDLTAISDEFNPERWWDGKQFLKTRNAPFMLSVLEKITQPGDVDKQIFFAYLAGIGDRHLGNYMISGNRIVTIDGEKRRNEGILPSLLGITNNYLFVVKLAQSSREWNEESFSKVQLDPKLAGEIADTAEKMADHLRSSGVDQDEVQSLIDRGNVLKEFSRSGDNSFKTLLSIFRQMYPGLSAI